MSEPQTVAPIPLQIPIRGLNKRDALAMMSPEYSPWCLNWEPEAQFLRVRNGFTQYCKPTATHYLGGFLNYANESFFTVSYVFGYLAAGTTGKPKLWDISTSTPSEVDEGASSTSRGPFVSGFHAGSGYFMQRGGSFNMIYTGGVWSAAGFTQGGSAASVDCFTSYKGRFYSVVDGSLWYSDLEAIAGALTEVDIRHNFSNGTDTSLISFIGTLTSPINIAIEQFLVLISKEGEVVVFGGDYPDAANWEVVARFKTLKPLAGYNESAVEINNDIWILTEGGVVSLRKAFQYGTASFREITVSDAINPYLNALARAGGYLTSTAYGATYNVLNHIKYWERQNKVVISMQGFIDQDGVYSQDYATLFIYNSYSEGWSVYKVPYRKGNSDIGSGFAASAGWISIYKNTLYYCPNDQMIMKYDASVFKDESYVTAASYASIPYSLQSAYIKAQPNSQVLGFEPIIKTDFDGSSVTMKAAADFGRSVSSATSVTLQEGYSIPQYNVGAQGTYLQYRMEGNSDVTAEDGLEVYSVGMQIK